MTLSHDPTTAIPVQPNVQPKLSGRAIADPSSFLLPGRQPQPIRLPGTDCLIKQKVPLSTLTSYRVGGPAELYAAPRTFEDLQISLAWANDRGLPVTFLGAGSNLLVSDRGLPGLVICTRRLRYTHFDDETGQVTAGAGVSLVRLAWQAAERGWQGFEWAVGIPGTVGGAVVMNAGAHLSCTADILVSTRVLDRSGEPSLLLPADLNYSYRSSSLQTSAANLDQPLRLVTEATLQLQPGASSQAVAATTQEHLNRRRDTQPYHLPSCGSVFRNPTPHKAGWLIEHAGLKGYQIGGAQIAQRHANFILNCGGATASDILNLICHAQEQVDRRWSLWLEPEVKMLGEFQAA